MMSAGAAKTATNGNESEQAIRVWWPSVTKLTCFDRQLRIGAKRSLASRDLMGRVLAKAVKLADASREVAFGPDNSDEDTTKQPLKMTFHFDRVRFGAALEIKSTPSSDKMTWPCPMGGQ
jgi:hypothetical protein